MGVEGELYVTGAARASYLWYAMAENWMMSRREKIIRKARPSTLELKTARLRWYDRDMMAMNLRVVWGWGAACPCV